MALSGWNPTNKLKLIIDSSKVDGDLTDFPVLVTLSSGTGQTSFDTTRVFDELTTSGTDSYTKLLLHMNGDQSNSKHTITSNGTPIIHPPTTFNGFNSLGYIEFDGVDESITIPDSSDWDFGSDDFTVDFWVYHTQATGVYNEDLIIYFSGTSKFSWLLRRNTDGTLGLFLSSNGTSWDFTQNTTEIVSSDTWHHIAIVRDSNTIKPFIDGTLATFSSPAYSNTLSTAADLLRIADSGPSTDCFEGYITEVRISKGIARWTSNFNTPTALYEVDVYTKLLLHMDGDQSDSGHAITFNGEVQMARTITKWKGSCYFDGTDNYVTIPNHADWYFSTDPVTIDFWVYFNSISVQQTLINSWIDYNSDGCWHLYLSSSNYICLYPKGYYGGAAPLLTGSIPISEDQFYHIAIVHNGTTLKTYVDGTEDISWVGTFLGNSIYSPIIGINDYDKVSQPLNGYIDELRISKGIARWTSNFTPPTTPHESDSYTKLLLHFDGDQSDSGHVVTFNGNPQLNSTTTKWDGSYYFDGTGDYLTMPDHSDWDFGTGNWTIDFWVYRNGSQPNHAGVCGTLRSGYTTGYGAGFGDGANVNKIRIRSGASGGYEDDIVSTVVIADITWTHVAFVRHGNKLSIYLDGVENNFIDCTGYDYADEGVGFIIGRLSFDYDDYYFNGYIDELRISKGIARWTSDFTLPDGPYGSSWDNRKKIAITDSNDNQLYTEIERWDYTNEEANLWTKVSTVTSGTDTILYLYYDATVSGNPTYVGDTGDSAAQSVWDSNFLGVWHMAQDPNGDGADAIKDSTTNSQHGTPGGTMLTEDLVDGHIGKGIDFDSDNDYINVGDITDLDASTTITWEATAKQATGIVDSVVIGRWNDDVQFQIWMDDGNDVWQAIVGDGANQLLIQVGLVAPTESFQYLACTLDGTTLSLFVDMANGGTDTNALFTGLVAAAGNIYIGADQDAAHNFGDVIDEVRISKIVRPAAWLKATYYSNWDDLIAFSEAIIFIFSNPIPTDLSKVYGVTQQLYLTTTVTGADPSYVYDATFYDASDDSITNTASGVQSGNPADVLMNTPSGINYQWYVTATSSGFADTSDTYTFTNKFLCEGQVQVGDAPSSGIPVRLYRRNTGEYIGGVISSGVTGTFEIETDYNEYHYAIALYTADDTNAIIADWLIPSN